MSLTAPRRAVQVGDGLTRAIDVPCDVIDVPRRWQGEDGEAKERVGKWVGGGRRQLQVWGGRFVASGGRHATAEVGEVVKDTVCRLHGLAQVGLVRMVTWLTPIVTNQTTSWALF